MEMKVFVEDEEMGREYKAPPGISEKTNKYTLYLYLGSVDDIYVCVQFGK